VPDPVVLVHGGAGWRDNATRLPDAILACKDAARAGQEILLAGGSALDAVDQAVRALEEAPLLNAGRGSYANTDGVIELDALIMDGATLNVGAVAGITRVLHPIDLARRVMTDTRHTLLVGEGASAFADSIGFPRADPNERTNSWYAGQAPTGDTVGAVALDSSGRLAVATSTGGIANKMPGRVGDTPLVGCGAYANGYAAVNATGDGEALMKLVISKHVADMIRDGVEPQPACESAIELLNDTLGAMGGLIAIDASGRIGIAFNSPAMPYAFTRGSGSVETGSSPGVRPE
jgi:L-asparaginase / beta-aspartyl-peptidase